MPDKHEAYLSRLAREIARDKLATEEKIGLGDGRRDNKTQLIRIAKKVLGEDA